MTEGCTLKRHRSVPIYVDRGRLEVMSEYLQLHTHKSVARKCHTHYHVQNSKSLFPVTRQIIPFQLYVFNFLKTLFNIILTPTPWSFKWSLSLTSNPSIHCMHFSSIRTCYVNRQFFPLSFVYTNHVWRRLIIMNSLSMKHSPVSFHSLTLRPKHFTQCPILDLLQLMFFFPPLWERPSFTPIYDNRQNYNYVCVSIYMLKRETVEQIILDRTVADIPRNFFSAFKFVTQTILIF